MHLNAKLTIAQTALDTESDVHQNVPHEKIIKLPNQEHVHQKIGAQHACTIKKKKKKFACT